MDESQRKTYTHFMGLAIDEARVALAAGEFPVGCVIVDQAGRVVATGARQNSTITLCEMDHAEIVALRNLQQLSSHTNLAGVTIYTTMEPCLMCHATLVVNGVRRIVYAYEDVMGGGTNLDLSRLSPLYASITDLEVVGGILRRESLLLFQQFFSNPDLEYLAGTLLATYTLEQKVE